MTSISILSRFDRVRFERLADWLAVAVAVSLPWSTSATAILIVLWLIAVLPTLDAVSVRRELATAAGGLPVLLWVLAAVGMLWADVSWAERIGGLGKFHRLLVIPLLLAQFRRSDQGIWVIYGFFASMLGLLLMSWVAVAFPGLPWLGKEFGVPVKDYIIQGETFLICAFVLLGRAFDGRGAKNPLFILSLVGLAVLFLVNIAFVATGRTVLLVAPVLALLLGWRRFRWQGLLAAALLGGAVGAALFFASPYLHGRLEGSVTELQDYLSSDAANPTGLHLEFLRKSLLFVETAPIIGHGTGSITEQFRRAAAVGQTGASSVASSNPHNQIFAVAIQLGLLGTVVLVAMWTAHVMLFRGSGFIAWIGLIVVVQNIVSSLFNSHLFDFTQGWLYVFGVGVVGGMVLREQSTAAARGQVTKQAMNPIRLPSNPRILVVVLRRLGDVLLTTPLIRSIKRAYPDAMIEALVFAGTEGILAGNPDLAGVVAVPQRLGAAGSLSLLRRLARRYDLALSTQPGDRPTTLAWIAGRQSAGLLEASGLSASLKRLALGRSCATDPAQHRVLQTLRLADLLGIPPLSEIVCPAGAVRPGLLPSQPYAVLHAAPMFTYKRWRIEGWRQLAAALRARGLAAVVTGGPADRAYLDEVWRECEVTRLDGALAWPELAALIGGASVYIGSDTAITHLAAAKGAQTVALYGPTDPRQWGPCPIGGLDPPWAAAGTIQHRGNVWLVQNPLPCLPCQLEGCERRIDSYSQCLDELSVSQVMAAVDQALAMRQAA